MGIPIFIVGLILLLLFTVIGVAMGPFIVTGNKLVTTVDIQPSTSETVEIIPDGAIIGAHPLHVIIKTTFIIVYSGDYNCRISVVYSPSDPGLQTGLLRNAVAGIFCAITKCCFDNTIISSARFIFLDCLV